MDGPAVVAFSEDAMRRIVYAVASLPERSMNPLVFTPLSSLLTRDTTPAYEYVSVPSVVPVLSEPM